MRYSKQRELVMQQVKTLRDHPTAEEIYQHALKECPGLSLEIGRASCRERV